MRKSTDSDNTMVLGSVRNDYNELRNFSYLGNGDITLRQVGDRIHILEKMLHRVVQVSYSKSLHSFSVPCTQKDISGYHFFNSIPLARVSWIVTFETTLPREHRMPKPLLRWCWSRLAHPDCKRIIAMSECACQRFMADLTGNRAGLKPHLVTAIRHKVAVIHPPQATLVGRSEKLTAIQNDKVLRLTLIGHEFYRKGGLELLVAVERLLNDGLNLELTIISKMILGDYASLAGAEEELLAKSIMDRWKEKIIHCVTLPKEEVIEHLKSSHILCLPTWGETYGYSVLEGQAAACPAITTNIRALPEINSDLCGWVIDVPKQVNGDADIDTPEKRSLFRHILQDGLESILREAYCNRALLQQKAVASWERIHRFHDPAVHASQLKELYALEFVGNG